MERQSGTPSITGLGTIVILVFYRSLFKAGTVTCASV